jgi:uncharacterized alkaline shock family protein YloU
LVTIFLLLVSAIVIPIVVIVPWGVSGLLRQGLDVLDASMDQLGKLGMYEQIAFSIIRIGVSVLAFILCVLLLLLEIRRPRARTVKIEGTGGKAEIVTESVVSHLEYHIDQLGDVIKVVPNVKSKGKSIEVKLYVETGPDIEVPSKTEEIRRVAKEVVETKLGLRLHKEIEVTIKPAPYPKELAGPL